LWAAEDVQMLRVVQVLFGWPAKFCQLLSALTVAEGLTDTVDAPSNSVHQTLTVHEVWRSSGMTSQNAISNSLMTVACTWCHLPAKLTSSCYSLKTVVINTLNVSCGQIAKAALVKPPNDFGNVGLFVSVLETQTPCCQRKTSPVVSGRLQVCFEYRLYSVSAEKWPIFKNYFYFLKIVLKHLENVR